MKIVHINCNRDDGAGTAVRRLHSALSSRGVDSTFIYFRPFSRKTAGVSWFEKKINGVVNLVIHRLFGAVSLNIFPSSLLRKINRSDADVVHLHWIHGEMLSVAQITKINKPIVWTFHSMWPMCGMYHSILDDRYKNGFVREVDSDFSLKASCISAVDVWSWKRKNRNFCSFYFSIITPSHWLCQCVSDSYLYSDYRVNVVPNCLDTEVFKPLEKKLTLRRKYGIPEQKRIILFGATRLTFLKGIDLLEEALRHLSANDDLILAVFGGSNGGFDSGIETLSLGRIEGDTAMAEVCNCADVVVVPSRVETFGQTASEPQACGVPVVAFNATGLKDVIEHKVTGYLAEPFDPEDFAHGIEWVLNTSRDNLSHAARERAVRFWSEKVVVDQTCEIYAKAMTSTPDK